MKVVQKVKRLVALRADKRAVHSVGRKVLLKADQMAV